MTKSAYPFSFIFAILVGLLLLTSCSNTSKRDTIHVNQQNQAEQKAAYEAKLLEDTITNESASIEQLVAQAKLENPDTTSLSKLLAISQDPNIPTQSQGLAALKSAELLFDFNDPYAADITQKAMAQWENNAYMPHMFNLLANQAIALENPEEAMADLTRALLYEFVDPYAVLENIELAQPLLPVVAQQTGLEWLLAVSLHDTEHQDDWLKQAASASSIEYVLQLRHSNHPLRAEQVNFYRYFARNRLMVGDYHNVRLTAKILENDMPESEVYPIVKGWAESEGSHAVVGILLPLSGKYAAYGEQALKGIRLAISKADFTDSVVLRIQDTHGENAQCVSGYQQLITQGAEWIIGPLLSSNTEALIPFLHDNIPVISLSNRTELAAQSPALFIHSLAKVVEANFMALYAYEKGRRNIAVLHGDSFSERIEAGTFAQTFIDAGGEIVDIIELPEGYSDNRPDLMTLRFHTDDDELLAELDDSLYLFSPEQNMTIKMPLAFDSLYIAASGKVVSVLAGQMAYAGIRNIQMYGSQRWDDGHLMDDQGRYLDGAEFTIPTIDASQPSQAILDVKNQYRVIWGNEEISSLFAIAYDTAMNVASIGTRLGIKGVDAIGVLTSSNDFPGISGDYHFNTYGISQKKFSIQQINSDRIETVQTIK